jgi:hypothetical protein
MRNTIKKRIILNKIIIYMMAVFSLGILFYSAEAVGQINLNDPIFDFDDILFVSRPFIDAMGPIERITMDAGFPEATVGTNDDGYYATPWPLSEDIFMVAYEPNYSTFNVGNLHYGIYIIDRFGNKEEIFTDGNLSVLDPRSIPGRVGARASRLYPHITSGHNNVQLSDEELHRISLWLDLTSQFLGVYHNVEAQANGEVVEPILE